MPTCQNCGNHFPNRTWVDGKEITLHRRKNCTVCNPIGERRFWRNKKSYNAELGVLPASPRRCRRHDFICVTCGKQRRQSGRNLECTTCRAKRQRAERKAKAVELLGGKCMYCGYSRCNKALVFHHTDPRHKDFHLSSAWTRSWEQLTKEIVKCVLLCNRCHEEVHEGIIQLAR